jgi:hypothetical protein
MINFIKQFSANFDKLPEELKFYYRSDLIGNLIVKITQEYKIDLDGLYDLIFDVVNNDFNFSLIKQYFSSLKIQEADQKNFTIDFIGQLFFPIDDYLKDVDLKQELIKRGSNPETYLKFKANFYKAIEDENDKNVVNFLVSFEKNVDKNQEKIEIIDLFTNNLVDILKTKTQETVKKLNSLLFFLLDKLETFGAEISQLFLTNQLNIGNKDLLIDEEKMKPTVANWLKIFIEFAGSGSFDNLTLAKFLSKNQNVQKLEEEDKNVIEKLLRLYRNLVFYPESMSNTPVEKWEIFPIDWSIESEESNNAKKTASSSAPFIGGQQQKPKETSDVLSSSPKPRSSNAVDSQISSLENILKDYSPHSLEYKALSQEINSLKQNTKKHF